MSFIFRKSINFGIFRINFNKNGVGFSIGIPGFRKTITSQGKKRTTFNIPGTGMSWRKDS